MKKIKLTQGKFTLVDDSDFKELSKYKWFAEKNGNTFYVCRKSKEQKTIRMHKIIMDTPKGMQTDHIDDNGLNNQKSNLRICTDSENKRNRGLSKNNNSGYKGVSWAKNMGKWKSAIKVNDKCSCLGYFSTKRDAAIAYNKVALKYFREFARINEL